jgi:type I restriction enzyme S subunit
MSSKKKATANQEAPRAQLVPKLRFPQFQRAKVWRLVAGDGLFDQINDRKLAPGLPILAITQEHGAIPREMIDYHVSVTEKSIESYKVVQAGDFIISLRSFQGGIEYSRYHGICSPAYVVLRLRGEFSGEYFRHYLKTDGFIRILTRNLEGIRDGKMISYSQFSELQLSVPAEVSEQQKIADCLSSLDELIAAQARKVEALKTHKKGLMQQLFPRDGETQPRWRFPEFRDAGEWEATTLKDIAKITSGSTPLRSNAEFFDGGTIPWVKTTDLNNSFIASTEEKITPKARARVNPAGSILVAMYGGFNQIGRTGCLSFPAATNQAISVLVLEKKAAIPVYVLAWLNAKVDDWRGIASSSRKDPNITGSDVADFPIALPEFSEQQRITDCLTSLDDLITAETQRLDALKTHKRALMQQLFPSTQETDA